MEELHNISLAFANRHQLHIKFLKQHLNDRLEKLKAFLFCKTRHNSDNKGALVRLETETILKYGFILRPFFESGGGKLMADVWIGFRIPIFIIDAVQNPIQHRPPLSHQIIKTFAIFFSHNFLGIIRTYRADRVSIHNSSAQPIDFHEPRALKSGYWGVTVVEIHFLDEAMIKNSLVS